MFKQRLMTSIMLVLLALFLIFVATPWMAAGLLFALVMGAAWEWTVLVPIKDNKFQIAFLFVMLILLELSNRCFLTWWGLGLIMWCFALAAIITYPRSTRFWGHRTLVSGLAFLFLPLFATSMVAIYTYPHGKAFIFYLLCIIWAADVGAYVSGKSFGKHKLIPAVSPGKTIEGLAGGLILVLMVAWVGHEYFFSNAPFVYWYGLAISCALLSIVGDLFFSMLKRRAHIKDSGHIFPGHGGVLDRLDSLIAAAPLFYAGLVKVHPVILVGSS